MPPLVTHFPESSWTSCRAERLSLPLTLGSWAGGACEGRGRESQSQDLACCPCRSGARFYCNPYILLQILNQLEPRLGWTLW